MTIITKANGEKEEFSESKLLASIKRAGIPHELQPQVLAHIKEKLYEGMPTSEIYKHISEFLHTSTHPYTKAKYSLKQAIMDLGPTGFPFEKFVARLLDKEGYKTQTNQMIPGKCVTHEIDVVATKDSVKYMVEAKFHNGSGIKTDVQVSLYTQARFLDVERKNGFTNALLVTNTKATTDAIAYAQCSEMDVITWSYPEGNGLRELVERHHLHPITTLSSLSEAQKQQLLEQNIVLCHELAQSPEALSQLGLSKEEQTEIIQEATSVCSSSESFLSKNAITDTPATANPA